MIDRRLFSGFDWTIVALTAAIIIVGLPVMYSASQGKEGSAGLFHEHLLRLLVGFIAMFMVIVFDYHLIARYAYVFYILNLTALAVVAVSGVIGFGARRWLTIGPIVLQPSEFFKLTLIVLLAAYLTRPRSPGEMTIGELGASLLFLLPPLALILKQPDLGTAGIVFFIYTTVVIVVGLTKETRLKLFRGSLVLALILTAAFYSGLLKFDNLLKPYQLKRIMVLFKPELDPLGASYHINQSKIAIGSGGVLGKGFLNGSQNQLRFLPQQHTDFIVSVLAEEWGFVGITVVISLYLILILTALKVARDAKDKLGSMLALGVAALIFYHTIINMGMTIGFMPVVGLPLPLLSFGGSSFLVVMIGIGLLMNIRMRRFIV